MRWMFVAVCLALASTAEAQDCTPVGINAGTGEWLGWGQMGERTVWGPTVPAGKIWLVDNIGIATTDNRSLPYAIQKFHPNNHYVPITGMSAGSHGTPTVGWTGRLILTAGATVGGRVNAPEDFRQMGLIFTGWEFPAACLGRLLGNGEGR